MTVIVPPWAENGSHQIRRASIVSTNARVSAPRNTSRWLNINTYVIYDMQNLSRSFKSVPNISNLSVFDGTMRFSGAQIRLFGTGWKNELEINNIQWNGDSELGFSWIFQFNLNFQQL